MSKPKSQTDFIRTLILHGNSTERDSLLHRMAKAEREEHSSRCALILVVILSLISVSAVCYGAVLLPDFFHGGSQTVIKFFCGLGLASMICSIAFAACWLWYRSALSRVHGESRRFLLNILDSGSRPQRTPLVSLLGGGRGATTDVSAIVRSASSSHRGYLELFSLRRVS